MKAAIWICLTVVTIIGLSLVWVPTIEFRVPNSMHGFLCINEDPNSANPKFGFYRWIIDLSHSKPPSVRNINLLRKWQHLIARRTDGSKLPVHDQGEVSRGTVFFMLGAPPVKKQYYFIGSAAEATEFLKQNERELYRVPNPH